MVGRNSRMQEYLHYRIRATMHDGRMMVGTLLAFDKHMNLVLADCDEFRRMKPKNSEKEQEFKRSLGLAMIRGENIVSFTAEAPPPNVRTIQPTPGPGKAAPAARGAPLAPLGGAGMSGPVASVGVPSAAVMAPRNIPAGMPPPPGMAPPPGMPPPPGMR